jgi:hypothetical protein
MVIQAAHKFTCAHEYVVVEKVLICHRCEQIRDELPLPKTGRKSLIFFPQTIETGMEAKVG